MYAIVLADDIGEKLWPVTNEEFPKAFLPVYSDNTLLEETLLRVAPFVERGDKIFVTVPEKGIEALNKQSSLEAFGIPKKNLIKIPENKGSMWSVLAACQHIKKRDKKEIMMIAPVDQFFWPKSAIIFHINNMLSMAIANPEHLMIMCLPPGGPSPLLNYVSGEWQAVKATGTQQLHAEAEPLSTLKVDLQDYKHRPDFNQAQHLLMGNWLWDLSTYMSSVKTIENSIREIGGELADQKNILTVWEQLPFTVFENSIVPHFISNNKAKGALIPKIQWSTVDNWVSIQHLLYDAGVFKAQSLPGVHSVEAKNNLVFKPPGKDIALFGVSNLIIIDTGDKLLIGTPGGLYENF
jgi:mannose-1-phosphate guanylyltransferase